MNTALALRAFYTRSASSRLRTSAPVCQILHQTLSISQPLTTQGMQLCCEELDVADFMFFAIFHAKYMSLNTIFIKTYTSWSQQLQYMLGTSQDAVNKYRMLCIKIVSRDKAAVIVVSGCLLSIQVPDINPPPLMHNTPVYARHDLLLMLNLNVVRSLLLTSSL